VSVYRDPRSPYWWLRLPRPGQPSLRESSRIPIDAPTAWQRQQQRQRAEEAYAKRMTELAVHRYELPPDRAAITLTAYAEWYTAHISAHKRGATREAEMLIPILADLGAVELHALTRDRVLEWRTARAKQVSAGTVNRELDLLKHMLASAVPRYLQTSPIVGLPRLRIVREETRILTREEETALLKALTPADQAIVIMALDTLARLSDVLALRRAQDHGRYLVILNPKTGASYQVPVSRRLRGALDAIPDDGTGFYFAHRRRAENPRDYKSGIKSMLEVGCAAATPTIAYGRKVGGVTFHCLRHTGASRMVEAGTDLRTVQELGGWSSLRQLSRYAHPTHAAKVAAVEAVSASAESLTAPKRKGAETRGHARKQTPSRRPRKRAPQGRAKR
jgi:integrase